MYGNQSHEREQGRQHAHSDSTDYAALKVSRDAFAGKENALNKAPDSAIGDMLEHDAQGRRDRCGEEKSPCGADADFTVARNLVLAAAEGVAAHGVRTQDVLMALKKASQGDPNLPILGKRKVSGFASLFGLSTKDKTVEELAGEIADILLEDMGRTEPGAHKTLEAVVPPERKMTWENLGLIPVGSDEEARKALSQDASAGEGDWRKTMDQYFRLGIAFSMNSVMGGSIVRDCLFGLPERATLKANLAALEADTVNIAIHDDAPLLATKIIEAARSEKFVKMAEAAGAKGIQFDGICCSDPSASSDSEGAIQLSNAEGFELVLATGALDLWVADSQDVFPGIMDVANCYKTVVVTTHESSRLPGAQRIGAGSDLNEMDKLTELADKIVTRAIESFVNRRDVKRRIPSHEMNAEVGFNLDTLEQQFGCMEPVASAVINGQLKGIITLSGCMNARDVFEQDIVDIVDILLANNILVFTNGCASLPLAKRGYCSRKALGKCGERMQEFLKRKLPPVWHFGECIDNARAVAAFREIAIYAGHQMKDMPFAELTPEWSNEKGPGAALTYRMLGFDSYHLAQAPTQGSEKIQEFLCEGTKELFGACMRVDTDPKQLAKKIVADFNEARSNLCWR